MIIIEKCGALTTIQDAGRFGYEKFGVSPSGPMDIRSFTLANLLVGNPKNGAALECTIIGPTLKFTEPSVVALTGCNMRPNLNGKAIPMYTAVAVQAGDKLHTGIGVQGCRCYIAVSGGLDVPMVMGSRATSIQNKIGGLQGRKLVDGDQLTIGKPPQPLKNVAGHSIKAENFWQVKPIILRVLMGPQEHEFTEAGISTFLNSTYRVGMDSNRMGYRLDGAIIEHKGDGNIISDGIVTGSVQVPTAGLPIVMLAERQTVGGYPKIATVISADLPKIGQCRPGDRIQFQKTTIEVAQKLHQEYINEMAELEKKLSQITKMIKGPLRSYNIKVNDTIYKFTVEEVL